MTVDFRNPIRHTVVEPRHRVASHRFGIIGQSVTPGGGAANSNYTRGESRHGALTPGVEVSDIVLVYANWGVGESGAGEIVGANNVTYEAAIEYSGVAYRVTFNGGSSTVVVPPGGTVYSDPLPIRVPATTLLWVRSGVTVASGETFLMNVSNFRTGEGGFNSTAVSSQVLSTGSMSNPGGGASNAGGIMPIALLAIPATPIVSVAYIGDSISDGLNGASDGNGNKSFIALGLYQAAADGSTYPQYRATKSGDRASSNTDALGRRKRLMLRHCTHLISECSTNDIANSVGLSGTQAALQEIWADAKSRGLKVYQTLCLPKTTGTFTTEAGQTPFTGFEVGGIRDQLNAWIITRVGIDIDGYIDPNPGVESQTNHGKWLANMTNDGTHPVSAAHTAMAAYVRATAAAFTI